MAAEGATVDFNTSPELVPWLEQVCGDNAGLVPNGYEIETPQSTWQNGWSFMASGVPSFEISAGGPDYDDLYHSTYENQDMVDWDLTAKMSKLFMRLNRFSDSKQLPYDFVGRADDLANEHFSADELAGAGAVDRTHRPRSSKAIKRFRNVSAKFGASADGRSPTGAARRRATPPCSRAAKKALKGMTALDAWDYTAYPHEQTMWDNEYMIAALDALSADPVRPAEAIEALTNVGLNWNGVVFSPSVYRYDLTRHDPDYSRVTWGKLGKLITYFDMTPVMAQIEAGQYDAGPKQAIAQHARPPTSATSTVASCNMAKALNAASDIMAKAM